MTIKFIDSLIKWLSDPGTRAAELGTAVRSAGDLWTSTETQSKLDEKITNIQAGANITINALDPLNPIINAQGTGFGDVAGPASAVDGNIALFNGTTGKIIKDGGTALAGLVTTAGTQTITGSKTVSLGTAATFAGYFTLQPTDWGPGKPRLAFDKSATATQWNIGLWDGVNSAGTINIASGSLTWNGSQLVDLASAQTVTGVKTFGGGLITANLAVNPGGAGNTVLELGRTNGASNTVLDFHSGATSVDYDARIQASGGTGAIGGGDLTVYSTTFTWNGNPLATTSTAQTITGLKTISRGAAATLTSYLLFQPTDYGVGKYRLYINKSATANQWDIGLDDGVDANGTINFQALNVTRNGSALLAASAIGSTVQGYDAATAKTNVAQQFTKPQRTGIFALTSAATITIDGNTLTGNIMSLTLAHSATLANPTNLADGTTFSIFGQQDATGGRTLAYASNWNPIGSASAPAIPTGANAKFRITGQVGPSGRIDFIAQGVGV